MNVVRKFIRNINPFKGRMENGVIEYILQKSLAFVLIYISTAVLVELIVMLVFGLSGYDFLHGEMPSGVWVSLLPFFGFLVFAIISILYVKVVEKRNISDMKMEFKPILLKTFSKGFFIGVILVLTVIGILIITGVYSYQGIGHFKIDIICLWLLAYVIQGSGEEIMCRGFLMTSLRKRIGTAGSIIISSIAFSWPHLSGILEMKGLLSFIAIMNLLLISILFSLAMLKENSIGIACGLHIGWNFFLGTICGLQVTGGAASNGILQFATVSERNWLSGGIYGIEASIVLTPILLIIDIILVKQMKGKNINYGVQQKTI